MRARRAVAPVLSAVLVALAVLTAGCAAGGPDDETEPRPTPTVTVTGDPVQELPARLDLASDLDFADEVVWAEGTTLHVGARTVELGTLDPAQLVVLDTGILVRTGTDVWFTAGRRAQGLPLPPVTSMAVSQAGDQLVLGLADREEPVAYTLDGTRVASEAVGEPRTPQRVVEGPGEVAPPPRLDVRGWTSPTVAYGLRGGAVVSCVVAGTTPRCERLARVGGDAAVADLVFGVHPAG